MSGADTLPHETVMKQIASDAAKEAITELFLKLGIDVSNPIDVQRDMLALRTLSHQINDAEIAHDMAYLRSLRTASDSIKSKTMLTLVGLLVVGLVSALVVGVKSIFAGE